MITDVYTVFEDALTRVLSENEYSLESTSLLSSARVEMNKVFDAAIVYACGDECGQAGWPIEGGALS